RRAVERGFAVRADLRAKFPTLETRVNRYVPVIHLTLRSVLFLIVGIALLQTWGIDVLAALGSSAGQRVIGSMFSIGIVAVAALVLWEGVSSAIERYLSQTDTDGKLVERGARARTLLPLLRNAILVVLVVMVTLIVLSEFGINIGPLLAGAGVVGLAIGFGSQKLVQDVITGVFILFEDTMSVGDVVTAGGMTGVVERLSIRSIRMRDLSGNVHTIPFSSVDTVTNMTKEFSMAVIEAGVAYRESVDDVIAALEQLAAEMQEDEEFGPLILEPLEMLGVDALADSAVVIKCRFKTVPLKQWAVRREFNRRMKNRFDELGIEIPFPHQTLYFGVDKDGTAPPAFVKSETERKKGGKKAKAGKQPETSASDQDAPTPVDLPTAGDV
ncbi:MAG: mechanosensitive ion channel, partial [Rhodospirillales bacterium]|nr:mechanosensitive ion channel [Rhodospirillales bacterium]